MTEDNRQLPDEIEKLLRKITPQGLQNTSSLDIDELELFKWYSEETEHVLDKILTAERQCIQEHIASGREDINDSGMFV